MHRFKAKQCYFCSQGYKDIDYKNIDLLSRFISSQSKIIRSKHKGTCAKHQRRLALSIKRARILGLLPFTNK